MPSTGRPVAIPESRTATPRAAGMAAGLLWRRLVACRGARLIGYERHRYQNFLQVLSGWLELGHPDRAAQYLVGLLEDEARRTAALRQVPLWAQLELVNLEARAAERGGRIRWSLAGTRTRTLVGLLVTVGTVLEWHARCGRAVDLTAEASPAGFRVAWPGRGCCGAPRPWPGCRVACEADVTSIGWRWQEEGVADVRR